MVVGSLRKLLQCIFKAVIWQAQYLSDVFPYFGEDDLQSAKRNEKERTKQSRSC